MTAQTLELKTLPPSLSTFFNAALTATRKPAAKIVLPELQVHVDNVGIERSRLRAYNKLLGFPDRETLPLTYPHVLGSALQMYLMAQPSFPLPMLGLVHLRNQITQVRPLTVDERPDLKVALAGSREVPAGLEFDLLTEFADAVGDPIWHGVSTYLFRRRAGASRNKPPAAAADEIPLSRYLVVSAPGDIGRRYAKVSGDYNPIHLFSLSAKLFGFQRAIATGMWTAARALALLEPQLKEVSRYAFQFKQPFLLPGRASLRFDVANAEARFALVAANGAKVHLAGTLR